MIDVGQTSYQTVDCYVQKALNVYVCFYVCMTPNLPLSIDCVATHDPTSVCRNLSVDSAREDETISTDALVDWLSKNQRTITINLLKVDFNPDIFLKRMQDLPSLSVVRSNDGLIAEVIQGEDKNDKSRDSTKFDLHTDGAYYPIPPELVILHCTNPGTVNIQTIFSDTRKAIRLLDTADIELLQKLEYYYIGRQGKEYVQPVIEAHFLDQEWVSNITARGYVRPSLSRQSLHDLPGMFDYIPSVQKFLRHIEENIMYKHTWKKNDCIIFDNHRFLHGRESDGVDRKRHLYRIWLKMHTL